LLTSVSPFHLDEDMLETTVYFHIWFSLSIYMSYWPSPVCPYVILGKYAALLLHLKSDLLSSAKHMFTCSDTALDTTRNQQASDGSHKEVPHDQ